MTSTSFGTLNTGGADKHKQLTTTEERNAHRTNDAVPHSPRFSNFSSQAQVQLGTANTIENHLHWLRNHEVRPWNERGVWFPSSFYSERAVENIEWGRVAGAVAGSVLTDESGKKAFEKALRLQDIEGAGCLSLVELDVQGLDSKGNRVRVQQIIEIKLGKTTHMTEKGTVERTTMTLKRVLKISTPDPSPYQTNSETRDQYATVARELAQHEVNKAFDERNAYLRDVFGLKVDHVRKRRSSTIPTHSWSFQRPEIWIRGPDGDGDGPE